MDVITVDEAVGFLNGLVEVDRNAVAMLFSNRVPCNEAMAEHPTVQVGVQHGGFHVGALGIINGMFGVDGRGWGKIAMEFEDDPDSDFRRLSRFLVLEGDEAVTP